MKINLKEIKTASLKLLILRNRQICNLDMNDDNTIDTADRKTLEQLGSLQGQSLQLFGHDDEITKMITRRVQETLKATTGGALKAL